MNPGSEEGECRRRALALLARREHSCAELSAKLRARGFGETEIEETVSALAGAGMASDRRFCEAFVRERAGRGQGPRRIAHALRERGVSAAIGEAVLAEFDARWAGLAARARVKRFGPAVPRERAERARQVRFLEGRGYTAGQVRVALEAGAEDGIEDR